MRAAPLALLLAAAPAAAQRHNSGAPISFDANAIELQDRANRAVLSGAVSVRQAEMTLDAQRVTVAYTGQATGGSPQVSRLDAAGNVLVRRPNQTARSKFGVYDVNRRVVTMVGAVTLTQNGNTVSGGRLTIDLDTGRAVIDGSQAGGPATTTTPGGQVIRRGGRVSGTFSVPKRN